MDDVTKKAEIDAYFKKEMEDSRNVWAKRGPEARAAAFQARQNGPKTWRQLKGIELMMHEAGHAGNRPFVTGLLIITAGCLYAQANFSDDVKKQSEYYQTFHNKDGKH